MKIPLVLSLDIGGTNSRIALVNGKGIIEKQSILTKDIGDVERFITDFLARQKGKKITHFGIGFAGPITGSSAYLTNANLRINKPALEKKLKVKIKLINDFQAIGYGIKLLKKQDLLHINRTKFSNKVNLILGPGTGLGKTYLIHDIAFASEGGHTLFGIDDIHDYGVMDFLKKQIQGEVYHEDIVSGRGLIQLYKYLAIKSQSNRNQKAGERIIENKINTAEMITDYSSKYELCNETLQLFTKYYARFARDSALHLIPSHIYLAGGISPAIKEHVKKHFMKEFVSHRLYSPLLKKINVSIILNTDVGLLGAARYAVLQT